MTLAIVSGSCTLRRMFPWCNLKGRRNGWDFSSAPVMTDLRNQANCHAEDARQDTKNVQPQGRQDQQQDGAPPTGDLVLRRIVTHGDQWFPSGTEAQPQAVTKDGCLQTPAWIPSKLRVPAGPHVTTTASVICVPVCTARHWRRKEYSSKMSGETDEMES